MTKDGKTTNKRREEDDAKSKSEDAVDRVNGNRGRVQHPFLVETKAVMGRCRPHARATKPVRNQAMVGGVAYRSRMGSYRKISNAIIA